MSDLVEFLQEEADAAEIDGMPEYADAFQDAIAAIKGLKAENERLNWRLGYCDEEAMKESSKARNEVERLTAELSVAREVARNLLRFLKAQSETPPVHWDYKWLEEPRDEQAGSV